MTIRYQIGGSPSFEAVLQVYRSSGLGERRPIDDLGCMQQMIERADVLVTAWDSERLVGVARTLTDGCYVAYLADLAVDEAFQGRGIGAKLVHRTRQALGPRAFIVLLAAPAAEGYYPHIGFTRHPQAWVLRSGDQLRLAEEPPPKNPD